jgi:hypothetical protein
MGSWTGAPGVNDGIVLVVVRAPSVRPKRVAPIFAKPGAREPTAIGLPTRDAATIAMMLVRTFAPPGRRAIWERQTGRLVAQEAFVTQPDDRWARSGPVDNADRVPWFFDGSRRFGLRGCLPKLLCDYGLVASPIVALR